MAADARSQIHEMGIRLAEEGRYDEALQHIREHLRRFPKDHQALNDVGVILFCMGANEEAIDHLERAKACCPVNETGEINWNLCETYLAAGYPGLAMKLFDEMERQEIMSPDLLNRGANAFLLQNMYGHAIELLLRSLEMAPSQEILEPMIEVVRSRRPKVGVFAREKTAQAQRFFELVGQRFSAALHTGAGLDGMRSWLRQFDIAFFDGCWDTFIDISYLPADCKYVVRLSDEDVHEDVLQNICWRNIDTVILTENPSVKEWLLERFPELDKQLKIVTTGNGVDSKRFAFKDKARGKRIACMDDLTLKHNPMLLLQCMQKLHYIDRDYRLYFMGKFTDRATQNYVRHMVEELELSDVVFFDSGAGSEAAWLRDKHYVVTAAIGSDGLGGVLKGMSCGLKPVVHAFPGARQVFEEEFLFKISEDFCDQILSERYEPLRYRQIVEAKYSEARQFRAINDVFFRLEKEVARKDSAAAAVTAPLREEMGSPVEERALGSRQINAMPAFDAAGSSRPIEPIRFDAFETAASARTPFQEIEQHPAAGELPQIAWSERTEAAPPRQSAARHLCNRVSSINQMSADILRDWKNFTEGEGTDKRDIPIEGSAPGRDAQPVEIASDWMDSGATSGGLKITELPARNAAIPAPAEIKHVPFV